MYRVSFQVFATRRSHKFHVNNVSGRYHQNSSCNHAQSNTNQRRHSITRSKATLCIYTNGHQGYCAVIARRSYLDFLDLLGDPSRSGLNRLGDKYIVNFHQIHGFITKDRMLTQSLIILQFRNYQRRKKHHTI